MKEFYYEYFHIPQNGKIREKVMLVRVAITVAIMIACLAAMSFTAYAYFSYSVTSGSNIIRAANFDVDVSIIDPDAKLIEVTVKDHIEYYELKADTEYTVTLTPAQGSTAQTGFCVVKAVGCTDIYHTQQLGIDGDETTAEISFALKISQNTQVQILAQWGTSSYYDAYKKNSVDEKLYILHGDDVILTIVDPINFISVPDTPSSSEPTDSTSEPTTDSQTTTEIIYTVQRGDKLGEIAKQYGVSIDMIAAYNGINNVNRIIAGTQIKIPPKDWKIPSDTTEQTEPAETTKVPFTEEPQPETQATETTGATTTEANSE